MPSICLDTRKCSDSILLVAEVGLGALVYAAALATIDRSQRQAGIRLSRRGWQCVRVASARQPPS